MALTVAWKTSYRMYKVVEKTVAYYYFWYRFILERIRIVIKTVEEDYYNEMVIFTRR